MKTSDLDQIIGLIGQVPLREGRRIIAIAGAPASGKTTIAAQLSAQIPHSVVVPMDGFHRDNDDLERDGLLARKGAPETFHASEFLEFIKSCRTAQSLAYPTFDRANDRAIQNGGSINPTDETILVEGNYLLLNTMPWSQLASEWDFSVELHVPISILRQRLISRWLEHGLDNQAAIARAESNDILNARLVQESSLKADYIVNIV